jgi:hypothetical protein
MGFGAIQSEYLGNEFTSSKGATCWLEFIYCSVLVCVCFPIILHSPNSKHILSANFCTLSISPIDPLHVTSRGARSGPPWRTTGAVFYGENVQRLTLPLVCKEGRDPFFSWLQYVRLTIACFEISRSWLASMHND